jgi:transposase
MDLGDKFSQLYVVDATGEEVEQSRIQTKLAAVELYFERWKPATRVVMEVGTHSGWISRLLTKMGHEVLVADPRKVRSLMGDDEKDDDLDAEFLARVGRMDPKLLKPVRHRSEQTQADLAIIRSRNSLVQARTQLVNHVRGMVKTTGNRLPSCSTERFHKLEELLPEVLLPALAPVMESIAGLTQQIRHCDRLIKQKAESDYPETELLRAVAGVGPLTALAFVLTLEDPSRFPKSRSVGPYLGLCRRRWKSSESDPQLRISKRGDTLLRSLLVGSANYILGPFGPDSDLRRWGLAYATRGGKNGKKRAVVGVARKLAVLLHSLWTTGEVYEPLRNTKRAEQSAA